MSFDDERVRFYLKHRDQIEEWAALRSEAAVAVDEWLAQLRLDVEELARSLGASVRVHALVGTEQAWPSFRLTDSVWDEKPEPASVALEWMRGRTTMRGTFLPYVGVKSPKTTSIGVALRASDAFRQVRQTRKEATTPWWASLKYFAPDAAFPASADAFRETLIEALRDAWRAYSGIVSSVVAGVPTTQR